jgi:ATP-dependent DNA ligase
MRLVAGVDGFIAEGAVVFAKTRELGLEGIVSKRASTFHKSGRSCNWLKRKFSWR